LPIGVAYLPLTAVLLGDYPIKLERFAGIEVPRILPQMLTQEFAPQWADDCRVPDRRAALSPPSESSPAPIIRFADDLYGAFPVKRLLLGLLTVLCSERERPFFIPSPAIRFPERAEGVKGPKR